MRFKNTPSINVVKREQKQQKIDQFVNEHLDALESGESTRGDTPATILLFARSPASPVARAVASQSQAIADTGIRLRAIFSQIGSDAEACAWTQATAGLAFARDIRLADNPALLDAHEQLVLDHATSWSGDCLRREPTSSDAYECYAVACELSARSGAISFERLWKICEPVVCLDATNQSDALQTEPHSVLDAATAAGQATSSTNGDNAGPLAGTRH